LIGVLQPFEDNRGIQAAGIGEDDFFDHLLILRGSQPPGRDRIKTP
jgi:hypothetical protein